MTSTPRARIDLLASAPQHLDHLTLVWHALPKRARGRFVVDQGLRREGRGPRHQRRGRARGRRPTTLVASLGDLRRARDSGRTNVALIEHGIAQSYAGDPDWAYRSSYPGGRGRDADLFLHTNETSAARDRAAYPGARIEVVGCPKLDTLPAPARAGTVIGVASEKRPPLAGGASDAA